VIKLIFQCGQNILIVNHLNFSIKPLYFIRKFEPTCHVILKAPILYFNNKINKYHESICAYHIIIFIDFVYLNTIFAPCVFII